MAEGRITPEKELLNLIESSKSSASTQQSAQIEKQALKRKINSYFSFGALIGRIAFFKNWLKVGAKSGKFYIDIKALNKILGFCIVILAAFFLINLLASMMNSKKILNLKFEVVRGGMPVSLPEVTALKPVSYYLDKSKSRNIFALAEEVTAKESEAKAARAKLTELAQSLKLVGISWSDDPDIIIEDTKAQQAFFLKKGQKINGLLISAVYKDKIVLSYSGEDIELR